MSPSPSPPPASRSVAEPPICRAADCAALQGIRAARSPALTARPVVALRRRGSAADTTTKANQRRGLLYRSKGARNATLSSLTTTTLRPISERVSLAHVSLVSLDAVGTASPAASESDPMRPVHRERRARPLQWSGGPRLRETLLCLPLSDRVGGMVCVIEL